MGYDGCDAPGPQGGRDEGQSPPVAIKILVAGGFGVGKTTFVGALTEIQPLRTEEDLSRPGTDIDKLTAAGKTATTVAMDFGRITVHDNLAVYLFGMPGQERFWFMWDDLAYGALGAVVLADTRRLADCFPALDYFEQRGAPVVVALNHFDGAPRYRVQDVRRALALAEDVPITSCDARQWDSCRDVLLTLVGHTISLLASAAGDMTPAG